MKVLADGWTIHVKGSMFTCAYLPLKASVAEATWVRQVPWLFAPLL